MKVLISKYLGFCNGVKNAYKLAVKTASQGEPTYMLGYLVHNQAVIEELEQKGVKTLKTLKDLPKDAKGYLIISAHGVSPEVQENSASSGLTVVDTTCPWVKKPQELAKQMVAEGYHVVIVGDKNHAEVAGIQGWAKGLAEIVENVKEAKKIGMFDKIAVIAQTTQARNNFDEVINELSGHAQELRVCDTICDATGKMQRAAVDIARRSEVMLVIGDKKSANTRRLKELCSDTGAKTYQIESAEDLDLNWLKGFDIIGVTAGASTPNDVIDNVLAKLRSA
jgi:(E)-4-hydroxy-3-methyl-but-2-enyl pyrophosphate reductase